MRERNERRRPRRRARAGGAHGRLFAGTGDVPACVANDADAGLAGAMQDTFDAALAACTEPPAFGVAPTIDQGVNDAAVTHVRGLVDDAFGSSPAGAMIADPTDTKSRRCQAAVVKGMESVVVGYVGPLRPLRREGAGEGRRRRGRARELQRRAGAQGHGDESAEEARRAGAPALPRRYDGDGPRRALRGEGRRRAPAVPGHARRVPRVSHCERDERARRGLRPRRRRRRQRQLHVPRHPQRRRDPFDKSPDGRIEGADVSLLEHPERHVTTGADGHFVFDGLEEGSEATLVLAIPTTTRSRRARSSSARRASTA